MHEDDSTRTTRADGATILADFRRRFADEFRGVGIDRIRVVLPGDKPGTYRVFVCEDADAAAACLHGAPPPSGGNGPEAAEAAPYQRPRFQYDHQVYVRVREGAFARSGGICQLCGQLPAEHAHHWALKYPPAHKTTAADLTALCEDCHLVFVTTFRRFPRAGGSRYQSARFSRRQ